MYLRLQQPPLYWSRLLFTSAERSFVNKNVNKYITYVPGKRHKLSQIK